jgi:hypothetical protein
MDLFSDMLKDVYRKIDNSNSSFCSTPVANTKKLTNKVARTILMGKGNADKLHTAGAQDVDECCCKKNCTHE